jgi:hypothetical protein
MGEATQKASAQAELRPTGVGAFLALRPVYSGSCLLSPDSALSVLQLY